MACDRRARTGTCNHNQCPYPQSSGYNCVEVIGRSCEVGGGCVGLALGCPYAWADTDVARETEANRAFADAYPAVEL